MPLFINNLVGCACAPSEQQIERAGAQAHPTAVIAGRVSGRQKIYARVRWATLFLLTLLTAPSHAILTIEITQGASGGMPIAVVPFGWQGSFKPQQDVAAIIEADLARSGRFSPITKANFISEPHRHNDVVMRDWQRIKADALVIGEVRQTAQARYDVSFRLYDIVKGQPLEGLRFQATPATLRAVAHQIADIIYEKLTGERGVSSTRIAYITREMQGRKANFKLQVADADGYNPVTIVSSRQPLMSPGWSPDGTRLAYVSFEQRRSMLYVQDVIRGTRQQIAAYPGINSAPAWSPDGRRLALTLSRDGNAEIYVMELASRALTRITQHPAIDTEPTWAPDGRTLVFTSDRSGRPQLFRAPASGGAATRISFEGDYNAAAVFSPDGKTLSHVTRQGGGFRIAVTDMSTSALQVLSDGPLDESPSFAPNGRLILYAASGGRGGELESVSADGRVRQRLKLQGGEVREPAWSPYQLKLSATKEN